MKHKSLGIFGITVGLLSAGYYLIEENPETLILAAIGILALIISTFLKED